MITFAGGLILLDVEGTVSPLAFVHEVMFPFARERAESFLERNGARPAVRAALQQMTADTGLATVAEIHRLMDADAKLTGLKQLQGLVWEEGFKSGELRATLFDDVADALRLWHAAGVQLRIYSSGSVHAQKLFFAHTVAGDLTPLLSGYYDTTTGPKRTAASYAAIAADSGFAPQDILFLSDVGEELDAAVAAGMQTALAIRPGNRDTKDVRHPPFHSLHDITIVRP